MMTNIFLDFQNRAIKELESIFLQAGWINGWEIRKNTKLIKAAKAPIFYRSTSPEAALTAILEREGLIKTANLFLIYNLLSMPTKSADNEIKETEISFALTIQYNNEMLFYEPENEEEPNNFLPYLSDMLDLFKANRWGVKFESTHPFEASEGSDVYAFTDTWIVEKNLFKN